MLYQVLPASDPESTTPFVTTFLPAPISLSCHHHLQRPAAGVPEIINNIWEYIIKIESAT